MDILFINSTDNNELRNEVNGTLLLATKLIDAGFEVQVQKFCNIESHEKDYNQFIKNLVDKIIELNPKSISFYTLWPYYHTMLRIAKEVKLKNSNIITVLGGPQSTGTAFETMQTMEFIDYVCTGEGENTVVPFFSTILGVKDYDITQIPGLYYRINGEVTFNHIPIPLTDLETLPTWNEKFFKSAYNEEGITKENYYMPVDVGRGCPYNCTFCCSSLFWNRRYRLKSAEKIIEEIKFYKNKFGINSFKFSHDAFTINGPLVSEVCDYIISNNLNIVWECTSRIDCITEELILKMKSAGLGLISLGIETGSERMQKLVKKSLKLEVAKEKIKFLIKNNIKVTLFFMYGFPDETEEDLLETLKLIFWAQDMGVQHTSMSFCKFNVATEITNKYLDELYYEPSMKILSNNIFGYKEELNLIKSNKKIFSHFYHLTTPVRDNYQYLRFLIMLYEKYRDTFRLICNLYDGDYLRLYKNFYNNNSAIFELEIYDIVSAMHKIPIKIVANTIKDFDKAYTEKILSVMQYEYNARKVSKAKEDTEIREKYNFSMIDLQMKLPITQFSNMKTEILLQKKNGKFEMKVVSIGV